MVFLSKLLTAIPSNKHFKESIELFEKVTTAFEEFHKKKLETDVH